MLLLITDTSGKHGFVGLARAGQPQPDEVTGIEEVPLAGGTFSAQLVPQISNLLSKHGLQKTDIGAFIVVSGPGSFTGLRVGLAAIKGLAEILQKPIVPVSLLEVIASAYLRDGRVLAVLDAGRGEVYARQYEISDRTARLQTEQLLPRNDFPALAHGAVVVTPEVTLAQIAKSAGLDTLELESVTPAMIARLGWRRWQSGGTVSPETLEANYIRRSDAEIFAKPATRS